MIGLTATDWAAFVDAINTVANSSFNQADIVWHRLSQNWQVDGFDDPANKAYTQVTLKCLVAYNYFRVWPAERLSNTGEIDDESLVLIFNKAYLAGLGYINAQGNFEYSSGTDYFVVDGVRYRSAGDTPAAQTATSPLLILLILSRALLKTGELRYPITP